MTLSVLVCQMTLLAHQQFSLWLKIGLSFWYRLDTLGEKLSLLMSIIHWKAEFRDELTSLTRLGTTTGELVHSKMRIAGATARMVLSLLQITRGGRVARFSGRSAVV
jgi:hypothetical protein